MGEIWLNEKGLSRTSKLRDGWHNMDQIEKNSGLDTTLRVKS